MARLKHYVIRDDLVANVDALDADVHGWSSDQLRDVALRLVAERAAKDVLGRLVLAELHDLRLPNGQRISGERRAEGDERVRSMRVLGRDAIIPPSPMGRRGH